MIDCGETKIKEKGNAERKLILVEEWIPDPHFDAGCIRGGAKKVYVHSKSE